MLTKTSIALAAALVAGTVSTALAQDHDWNPANRYPAYASPEGTARAPFQSSQVGLTQGRYAVQADRQYLNRAGQQSEVDVDLTDRASSPYAGAGN